MVLIKFPLVGLLLLLTIIVSPATADGPVCPPSTKLSRASFPEGFLFGTATAAYQVQTYSIRFHKYCLTVFLTRSYVIIQILNVGHQLLFPISKPCFTKVKEYNTTCSIRIDPRCELNNVISYFISFAKHLNSFCPHVMFT